MGKNITSILYYATKPNKVMIKDAITGGTGILAIETAQQINLDQIENGIGLLTQIIIGIITIVKLFKKPKSEQK